MTRLFEFIGDSSQKFWEIEQTFTSYTRRWGRIGTTGQVKIIQCETETAAREAVETFIRTKLSEGYVERTQSVSAAPTPAAPTHRLLPMLANEVNADRDLVGYTHDDDVVFEPKLDGHRVMVVIEEGRVTAIGRNGQASQHKPLFTDRHRFPHLKRLAEMVDVTLDGELVDGKLWIFDMPFLNWRGGLDMNFEATEPWRTRRKALGLVFETWSPDPKLFGLLSYAEGWEAKEQLVADLRERCAEGVIIKDKEAPYRWGRRTNHTLKAKFWKSADLVVTAVGVGGKGNVALSAWKDGVLVPVGKTSTNGKGVVPMDAVVEVRYLYLGPGDRLVQPDLLRVRTDKSGPECSFDQLVRTNKEVLA